MKTLFFIEMNSKIDVFCRKMSKRPQDPIGTSKDDKNYFFELPGYETPCQDKEFWCYLPYKKMQSYHGYSGHDGFSGSGA